MKDQLHDHADQSEILKLNPGKLRTVLPPENPADMPQPVDIEKVIPCLCADDQERMKQWLADGFKTVHVSRADEPGVINVVTRF